MRGVEEMANDLVALHDGEMGVGKLHVARIVSRGNRACRPDGATASVWHYVNTSMVVYA